MNLAGDLAIRIRLDTSELTRGLQRTTQQVAAAAQRMGRSFDNVSKSMTQLGGEFSAKLTAPVGLLGAAVLKMSGDFEASMNLVGVLVKELGSSEEEFARLGDLAMDLGAKTVFSAKEVADAMSFMAMAGMDAAKIYEGTGAVLSLAAAGQMDLARAADIVTNVMASQGMEAAELDRAVNVLSKAFTSANTDLSQLGQAFKFAGPVSKATGVAFEEAAAALALMGNAGIQSTMAGRSLRMALIRLLDPPKEAARALAELGVQTTDANGRLRDFSTILNELQAAGITPTQISDIFGVEAFSAIQALFEQGIDTLDRFSTELENVGDVAENVSNARMKGLNGALEQMRGAFETLSIAIGQSGVADAVADFATASAQWFESLSRLNPEVLRTGAVIAGLAAAIGPALIALGAVTWAVGQLATAVGVALAVLSGPVGLTVALVAAGAALAVWLNSGASSDKVTRDLAASTKSLTQAIDAYNEALAASVAADEQTRAAKEEQVKLTREQTKAELEKAKAILAAAQAEQARAAASVRNTGGRDTAVYRNDLANTRLDAAAKNVAVLENELASEDLKRVALAKLNEFGQWLKSQRKPEPPPELTETAPKLMTAPGMSEDALDAREALRLQVAELEALAVAAGISGDAMERLRIKQDILASGWEGTGAELSAYVDRIVEANATMDAAQGLERELVRMGEARDAYRDAVTDREALIDAIRRGEEAYEREYLRQQLVADGLGDVNRRLEEQIALRKREEEAGSEARLYQGVAASPFDALKRALATGEGTIRSVIADVGDRIGIILLEELVFRPMDELAKALAKGLQDAFNEAGSAFMASMNGGSGNSIWSAIGNAVGSLFGGGFSGGGGTDVLGGGSPGDDMLGAVVSGTRAIGGTVVEGAPVLVGERGPEIFVPSKSGKVEPLPRDPGRAAAAPQPKRGGQKMPQIAAALNIPAIDLDLSGLAPRPGTMADALPAVSVSGARAIGGTVTAGAPYLVGERGPELFMPSVSGTVEPGGMGGKGSGPMTFAPVLNFNGGEVSRADLDAALTQARAEMLQGVSSAFPGMFDRQLQTRKKHGEDFAPRRR